MPQFMRSAAITVFAFAAMLTVPLRAEAQDDPAYQNQVYNSLMRGALIKDAVNHNFQMLTGGYRQGYIRVGQGNYQTSTFHLEAGYVYLFLGACDSDCTDIDFDLVDNSTNGILLQDTDPDDTPAIQFEPRRTGDYTIVARTPKCTAVFGCYWAVQALWK